MRVLRGILLSAFMVFALAGTARAQALGQILGVVTDAQPVRAWQTDSQPRKPAASHRPRGVRSRRCQSAHARSHVSSRASKFVRQNIIIQTGFAARSA
jgi:hypothetical protein